VDEAGLGVATDTYYAAFAIASSPRPIASKDSRPIQLGRRLAADCKGVVLLNRFGLGVDRVRWVADVSPTSKVDSFNPPARVDPKSLLGTSPGAAASMEHPREICRRNQSYLDRAAIRRADSEVTVI
jgi:hypothetical protein